MGIHLNLLIICPIIFVAGIVDSIAGGGGLISLPGYLIIGVPIHTALGTNKFSSTIGTTFSAYRFIKNKKVYLESAVVSIVAALIGSSIGAKIALALSDKYLRLCLLILIPLIAVFILTRRNFGDINKANKISTNKVIILSIISGLVIGAYDGFFGPGTGAFLILIYTAVIGLDITTASGNAKLVNLASNIAALITFWSSNNVMFSVGIPAAFFGICGNWIGSGLAIRKGSKAIKPIFIGVLVLLFIKIVYDFIG